MRLRCDTISLSYIGPAKGHVVLEDTVQAGHLIEIHASNVSCISPNWAPHAEPSCHCQAGGMKQAPHEVMQAPATCQSIPRISIHLIMHILQLATTSSVLLPFFVSGLL